MRSGKQNFSHRPTQAGAGQRLYLTPAPLRPIRPLLRAGKLRVALLWVFRGSVLPSAFQQGLKLLAPPLMRGFFTSWNSPPVLQHRPAVIAPPGAHPHRGDSGSLVCHLVGWFSGLSEPFDPYRSGDRHRCGGLCRSGGPRHNAVRGCAQHMKSAAAPGRCAFRHGRSGCRIGRRRA